VLCSWSWNTSFFNFSDVVCKLGFFSSAASMPMRLLLLAEISSALTPSDLCSKLRGLAFLAAVLKDMGEEAAVEVSCNDGKLRADRLSVGLSGARPRPLLRGRGGLNEASLALLCRVGAAEPFAGGPLPPPPVCASCVSGDGRTEKLGNDFDRCMRLSIVARPSRIASCLRRMVTASVSFVVARLLCHRVWARSIMRPNTAGSS
jgi:hypothetical protein